MALFLRDADFEAFERAIEKTVESRPMRICSHCLMSIHWHFALWPEFAVAALRREAGWASPRARPTRGQGPKESSHG
jgi:hypothetical protein